MRILVAAAVVFLSVAGISVAEEADAAIRKSTHIAAQLLEPALQVLAKERGFQVVYRSEVVGNLRTPGASGDLTADEALSQLLNGTDLTFQYLDDKTVTIVPLASAPVRSLESAASSLRKAAGEAEQGADGARMIRFAESGADQSSRFADSPSSAEDSSPSTLDEQLPSVIVQGKRLEGNAVTGTKTDTPLMATPMSVQVIDQQVLIDQQAMTLDDVLKNISGVKSNHQNDLTGESIVIRGFSTNTFLRDGMRTENNTNFYGLATLTNVERVEVLKGPAAVLYGRGEPGGVVNLIKKRPEATPFYLVEQKFGTWSHFMTTLDATGPVNEDRTLLYRATASYDDTHTWVDHAHDKTLFATPSLTWIIDPHTQVTAGVEYTRNTSFSGTSNTSNPLPYDTAKQQFVWIPRNINLIYSPSSKPVASTITGYSLNWTHQFNANWTIDQKLERRIENGNGLDTMVVWGLPFTYDAVHDTWTVSRMHWIGSGKDTTDSTTLDLTGHFATGPIKHTLLVGGDYSRNTNTSFFNFSDVSQDPDTGAFTNPLGVSIIDVFHPDYSGPLPPLDPIIHGTFGGEHHSYGFYIQDQIALPHDFHLLAGLRYQNSATSSWGNLPAYFGGTGVRVDDSPWAEDALTPRAGALWQPRRWLSVYASYTENFGAANQGYDWQHNPLKPESATQKELGVKTEFFESRLSAGVSLFNLAKTDVAVYDSDPVHQSLPACVQAGCFLNAASVVSKGVEFDLQGEVAPGWNLIVTYSNTDIRYGKNVEGTAGFRLQDVPRNLASLWTTYEFKALPLRGLKLGFGMSTRTSAVDYSNTLITPGFTLAEAMAAYSFKVGEHDLAAQLNVDNLFDKNFYTDAYVYDNGFGGQTGGVKYGARRAAMLSIRLKF